MEKRALTAQMITEKFREKYHSFIYFLDDEDYADLRDLCFKAATDSELLSHIKFCNDTFHIQPVRTFLVCYKDEIKAMLDKSTNPDKKLTPEQKRGMGAFWGTVFKCLLGYTESKNAPLTMKEIGISTASYFFH